MRILLIGASSYVGARLFLDLSKKNDVTGTYANTRLSEKFIHLDITDRAQVLEVVGNVKPDLIIHVANNANARWCEANPKQAQLLNVTSTAYIVEAANSIDAKVIYISSFAALNLNNVYGRTKAESEEIIKKTVSGWLVLRPSYIVGYSPNTKNDRPFNRILKNLYGKIRAEYDTSWKFHVTWVGHISEVIVWCLERNVVNEVIPVASPELKSRFDVAKDLLTPFGIPVYPVDKKDNLPVTYDDMSKLISLKLPYYSYRQIVDKIVGEMKNKESFELT